MEKASRLQKTRLDRTSLFLSENYLARSTTASFLRHLSSPSVLLFWQLKASRLFASNLRVPKALRGDKCLILVPNSPSKTTLDLLFPSNRYFLLFQLPSHLPPFLPSIHIPSLLLKMLASALLVLLPVAALASHSSPQGIHLARALAGRQTDSSCTSVSSAASACLTSSAVGEPYPPSLFSQKENLPSFPLRSPSVAFVVRRSITDLEFVSPLARFTF